jgi:outer membrane protein assembly factor BamD
MRNIILQRLFIFSLCLLFLTGCGTWGGSKETSARELAMEGIRLYEKGRYRDALEVFDQIKEWYPFSPYVSLAELKKADTLYKMKEYPQAILAYEEFENLHPQNEAVPYVVYQIGRCYFDQMDTVDRDQQATQQAITVFNRLILQHPQSPYADKAKGHISECRQNLAGHELYVGRHYYKGKRYKGAFKRMQTILTQYPETDAAREAAQLLEKIKPHLAEKEG